MPYSARTQRGWQSIPEDQLPPEPILTMLMHSGQIRYQTNRLGNLLGMVISMVLGFRDRIFPTNAEYAGRRGDQPGSTGGGSRAGGSAAPAREDPFIVLGPHSRANPPQLTLRDVCAFGASLRAFKHARVHSGHLTAKYTRRSSRQG